MTTPSELGYRMPAEWEPHSATWLSWPHNEASWPGKFVVIPPVYAQMAAALARSEPVHINVNDAEMERQARSLLKQAGATGEIHFHHFPTNDAWCRDHGAIFLVRDDPNSRSPQSSERLLLLGEAGERHSVAAVNWNYNAWGGKYPHALDNQIPQQMAAELDVPLFDNAMVLEGGSIDVNGRGLLMTTTSCLLNPNRNPTLNQQQIEEQLTAYLGVEEFLWLGDGIEGDDTDGHIDDLARFVAEDVVVTTVEPNAEDVNHRPLSENLQTLKNFRTRAGRSLQIVELPMPPAVVWEGQRLPATYANFYIANRVVLLPGYNKTTDETARSILQDIFPTREVIVIDCSDLIWGLGAFHCLTQQVPAG